MKTRVSLLIAAVLVTIGIATPAYAYPSSCNISGYICYYSNTAGTVLISENAATVVYAKSVCYSGNYIFDAAEASYISNPSASNFVVYLNTSCSGTSAPVYAHSSGAMNSTWNKRIRSLVRVS
jgi:hypothetical protein